MVRLPWDQVFDLLSSLVPTTREDKEALQLQHGPTPASWPTWPKSNQRQVPRTHLPHAPSPGPTSPGSLPLLTTLTAQGRPCTSTLAGAEGASTRGHPRRTEHCCMCGQPGCQGLPCQRDATPVFALGPPSLVCRNCSGNISVTDGPRLDPGPCAPGPGLLLPTGAVSETLPMCHQLAPPRPKLGTNHAL